MAGATGWTGRRSRARARPPTTWSCGPRSAALRPAASSRGAPGLRQRGRGARGRRRARRLHLGDGGQGQHAGGDRAGVAVVIGTSGLTAADFEEIDAAARERGRRRRRRQLLADRRDVPGGGAARGPPPAELGGHRLRERDKPDVAERHRARARRAARRRASAGTRPPDRGDCTAPREARGATVAGTQVHSCGCRASSVSTEVVFGLPDERLTIRHDAGATPEPYVAGTLLAVAPVPGLLGLTRGLDTLLLDG